jgi:hypothetical protein
MAIHLDEDVVGEILHIGVRDAEPTQRVPDVAGVGVEEVPQGDHGRSRGLR